MENSNTLQRIATVHTDFPEKFGIPRQSGLIPELMGRVVFEPEFGVREAFLGMEEFSHLWLLWGFSEEKRTGFKPSIYPPRLNGKVKKGVFATRAPFRPNKIGLSCVKLEKIIWNGKQGVELLVSGVDMLDGTPVYDVKPYLSYTDSRPEASGSFGQRHSKDRLEVKFPQDLLMRLPKGKRAAAIHILEQDPRAAYQKEPGYVYGITFAGYDIRFTAEKNLIVVADVVKVGDAEYRKIK